MRRDRTGPAQTASAARHPEGVVTMVRSRFGGNGQSAWPARFRLAEPRGHWRRWRLRRASHCPSTFLRSLRSMAVTPLPRYYGRSDSCPHRRGSARVSSRRPPVRLLRGQVSLIHAPGLLTIPSPTTGAGSALPGHVTRRQVEPRPHPPTGFFSQRELGALPLHCRFATSRRPNRVHFPPSRGRLLTDWSFTSCCCPPRLTTTQLQSVTGLR